MNIDKLISRVLSVVETIGLSEITPQVLGNGGNLIIHLAPYPIVARLANIVSKDEAGQAYKRLHRELHVARHLHFKNVPVLLPTELTDAGPYIVDGTWMTLWTYVPPVQLQRPTPGEAVKLVDDLSKAMKDFVGELPALGVWERTAQSAERLMRSSDKRIHSLLTLFHKVDKQMRLETRFLIPCHGDAHARNLVPSSAGWLWTDFEDVSLMPLYWDQASYVGNLLLFNGLDEPTFRYMLSNTDIIVDRKAFGFALTARILMSTLGNLDYAVKGYGDMKFADQQLELAEHVISEIGQVVGNNRDMNSR
ncbi:phosphotransferase [Paenibacillus sp. 1001270B_150601_E10]|uniref:phosphotransferase n=1 Tax=Paenibacillus sp. 1001270B_150601_E10 TaxID=2787079 RepID=UPI00189DFB99|nr:phosphotransferase [Paenibacillus sp. 1001270B_150601_E10]